MRHLLEHVGYLAKPLDLVRIFCHRGREAIMFCAFEKVGGHVPGMRTAQFALLGQSLNSHRSRYGSHVDNGDGHVLDLLSRIQRPVDHDRHVFGATLRLSQRKLSKQNDVRPTYDFRGDRQVLF